ncbi:hypothetical protein [Haloferula sargassicola]|uniref:NAD(P)H-quinone oxidoreductase subunit H, chloroplastic n=1 Tax=Haloferula sargassicola TaxID=490096 RepID=A0ABP9UMH9_9BACT
MRAPASPAGTAPGPAWKRALTRLAGRHPRVFAIPGPERLELAGLAVHRAGIDLASTPRHARILLVDPRLPPPLRKAAAIAYAQMPRPRRLVFLGNGELPPLPEPDLRIVPGDEQWAQALQALFSGEAEPEPFAPDFLREALDDDEEGHEHHHHDHGDDEEDGCDHDDMGFMSMVSMTKDMPRSRDGLAMNRSTAHFGPFFPGLPGGVVVKATLDGDSVCSAEWAGGHFVTELHDHFEGPADPLPDFLAALHPGEPETWRALGILALAHSVDSEPGDAWWRQAIPQLERERAASHLAWLSVFAVTVGSRRLERHATRSLAELREGTLTVERARKRFGKLEPYLARRLRGIGPIPREWLQNHHGPLARAAGMEADLRAHLSGYRALGFEPCCLGGNDALARLRLRLAEIIQSAGLCTECVTGPLPSVPAEHEGSGEAAIETARGPARLKIEWRDGRMTTCEITAPSAAATGLIPDLTEGLELSDALVAIASLDLSPWETPLEEPGEKEGGDS